MDEQKLAKLEEKLEAKIGAVQIDVAAIKTDVAVVESTISPLISKMDEATKATIKLTTKLSELVINNGFMQTAFDEVKIISSINSDRIKSLEDDKSSRRSGDDVKKLVISAVVRTVVPAVLIAVLFFTFNKPI